MKTKIWLSSPHMGGNEQKYVLDAFHTNWVAPIGPNVNAFENEICNYLNPQEPLYAASLSSGTAALHLAIRLLNIGPGDIVLIQSFTFCGTSNPVAYQGAELVFIDSEMDTWNMCPKALEEAINIYSADKIKAIVPVHLYGMPAKMDEIVAISTKYGIPIIEDAAESLGSKYKNNHCGTFGLLSALSFNGNKIITTSGGGALISRNLNFIEKAKFYATQARDEAPHYQHSEIGYNYRLSNILAGIGRGQLEILNDRVQQRRKNNLLYRTFFENIPGITFQTEPNSDYFSNYWLTAIIVEPTIAGIDREAIRIHLEKEGIESRPVWKPLHLQPINKGRKFIGDGNCEKLFEQGLCLPSGSNLTFSDFERIFNSLSKILSS